MFDRALKAVRQYHRLSQSDLADRLEISRSYVNELEKGKKEPSIDVLRKYSEYFRIPVSSLMLFAENSSNEKASSVRTFAADKVLRILEWLSEDLDDNNVKRASAKERKNSPGTVPSVPAPVSARTRNSSRNASREVGAPGRSKQVRRIHA
jgi:transcriptional regulator with XRE-family HTH domain